MRCPTCRRYLLPGGSCPVCQPARVATGAGVAPGPAPAAWGSPSPRGVVAPANVATVVSRPVTTAVAGPPNRGLRALGIVLGMLLVATSPGLLSHLVAALFIPLLLVVLVLWLMSRFGLLSVFGFLLFRPRSGRALSTELAFRCDRSGIVTDVRLRGHSTGVAVGDLVSVRGVTVAGVVHASQVRNMTTGAVLSREGLLGTIVLAVFDTLLLLSALGHIL